MEKKARCLGVTITLFGTTGPAKNGVYNEGQKITLKPFPQANIFIYDENGEKIIAGTSQLTLKLGGAGCL